MKSDTSGIITLKNEELKALLNLTKETIATDIRQGDLNRSFGVVDLWNRQKRQRSSLQMRRWLS